MDGAGTAHQSGLLVMTAAASPMKKQTAVMMTAAVAILKRMGKADPMFRQVYVRHVKYQPFYTAKSFVRSRTSEIPALWR